MKKPGVTREIGTGVLVRGWTQVTAFVVVVVAGRILDRQEFGIFAVASVFTIVLSTIIYSGIYEYIIKHEDYAAIADTCFWINLGLAAGGAVTTILLAPVIAYASHTPEIQTVMIWLAPSALIAALTSWQEALALRKQRVTTYYIIWFFSETLSAAIAVGLFLSGIGLYALVGYRYSQLVLTSLGYLLLLRDIPRFAWSTEQARLAMAFASRLYGSRVIGIITNYGADLIIGILASPAAAGAYRLASRMVFGLSELWFQPIKTIAWVRFSSAVRDNRGLGPDWLGLMMVLSMVVWPTLGGVAVLAGPLTNTVLGSGWLAAAPIVVILSLAKSTELFEVFLDPLLTLSGGAGKLLRIRAAASVVAMIGFVALARFGAAPAAWAQGGTYLLLAAVTVRIGIMQTGTRFRTVVVTLLPGVVTTVLTMVAAASAASLTSGTGLPAIAEFACNVAAGAVVWAFLIGVIFRKMIVTAIMRPNVAEPVLPNA